MADGRQRDAWNRTSHVLWILAEINRDPAKRARPFEPQTFNPYADEDRPPDSAKPGIPITADNIHVLKKLIER